MSGPPDALQRLAAIINFSGGRSSAFMLWRSSVVPVCSALHPLPPTPTVGPHPSLAAVP